MGILFEINSHVQRLLSERARLKRELRTCPPEQVAILREKLDEINKQLLNLRESLPC
jgi:uncharacterized coiled-coil DUF342 family protein